MNFSNSSISSNNNRKRLRDASKGNKNHNGVAKQTNGTKKRKDGIGDDETYCSFCLQVPAALSIDIPVLRHRSKRVATPYCVACYYTSAVVRFDVKYIHIMNQEQLQVQLPPMQQMFNEVFLELQKDLSEEATKSFQKMKNDPLGAMMFGGRASKPAAKKKTAGDMADGGFLRKSAMPNRLLQTQQQQARLHEAQIQRMNQAAAVGGSAEASASGGSSQLTKRRKSSGKSIWNLAMDPNTSANKKAALDISMTQNNPNIWDTKECGCGSSDVTNLGSNTSRNQDMRKGETWGMKDRGDDVMTRYQCNKCGKIWNEEE